MATPDNPIILGRRNCSRCGRWRHTVDFKWRWPKRRVTNKPNPNIDLAVAAKVGYKVTKTRALKSRRKKPTIGTICASCSRRIERERYNNLSEDERKAKVHQSVENIKAQKARLKEQIHYAQLAHHKKRKYRNDQELDLVPFRMWLLGKVRAVGGIEPLALESRIDEKQFRRWADGYDWDSEIGQAWSGCEPKPIHSIKMSDVDVIGVALGEPDLLERLYPYAESEE